MRTKAPGTRRLILEPSPSHGWAIEDVSTDLSHPGQLKFVEQVEKLRVVVLWCNHNRLAVYGGDVAVHARKSAHLASVASSWSSCDVEKGETRGGPTQSMTDFVQTNILQDRQEKFGINIIVVALHAEGNLS